jgi:hypothetical protein
MIYLSKPIGGAPRYVAERLHHGRFLVRGESLTGKVADLRQVASSDVPRRVRQQIAKARYRTKIAP